MKTSKLGDGVVFVTFLDAASAIETFSKWQIAKDKAGASYTINDVLHDRMRWPGIPLTYNDDNCNFILEIPLSIDSLQSYTEKIKGYMGENGAVIACTWIGSKPEIYGVYDLGGGQKAFQNTIDTFMPLREAKAEFFTLREVLYRSTMDKLIGKETEAMSETELQWLARFVPID